MHVIKKHATPRNIPVLSVKTIALLLLLSVGSGKSLATAWTTATAGGAFILSNWTDGTSAPTSFYTPGDTWTITKPMTLGSSTWMLGTASTAPVSLIFDPGGSLTTSGLSMSTLWVNGNLIFNGGNYELTGSSNGVMKIYGNMTMNSGAIKKSATSNSFDGYIYGNCSISGGSFDLDGSWTHFNVYGNYSMTGGSINAIGGVACTNLFIINGDFSMSGPSAFANTGSLSSCEVWLVLPGTSGTTMISNTSTGAWSKTNVVVYSGCIAQLAGNFSTTNPSAAYGLAVVGTLICPAAYVVNGTGAFSVTGKLLVASPGGINGNITATGTLDINYGASYTFNGTTAQVTGTSFPASLASTTIMTIDNAAGVTLSQSTKTYGTLAFVNGKLHTGAFTMSADGASGSVTGAGTASYVNGTLKKSISGYTSVNYEVGDLTYAPVKLALSSTGTGGDLGVKVTNGLHPAILTSGVSSTSVVNHYWTITNYAATGPATIDPTVNYFAADILGGSNTAFVTSKYTASTWSLPVLATTNTSSPFTSSPNVGITRATIAGDYIFGDAFCGTLPITGAGTLCSGTTVVLSDATPGGIWTSGATSVASVGTAGNVTGIIAGTAAISYTVSGCTVTKTMTVTATSPITGASSLCAGTSITLSDASPGGVWSSSATTVATVGTSGTVSGLIAGTATISYTVSGCTPAMRTLTVNATSPITGASALCAGMTIALTDATPGGAWTSSATSVATVGSAGSVSGAGAGTATISYTVSGCTAKHTVTVTVTAPITGPGTLCAGTSVTFSDASPGGAWTSSTTSVATVGTAGIVAGVSAGTTTISYTVSGCTPATRAVTVISTTSPIAGPGTLCAGSSVMLSDATPGGVWNSGTTSVATVGSSGSVSGMSAGTATISYTASGCTPVTKTMTVIATSPITGAGTLCAGSSITLTDATPGGTWASSTTSVATVGTSGSVAGIGAGTTTISYTAFGCLATKTITVTATSPISGVSTLCVGTTIALSDATPGGTWASSAPSVATIGTAGSVLGIGTGTTTISYSVSGCTPAMFTLTVSTALPIAGASTLCQGMIITLSDASTGGVWTSSAPATASVSTSGDVSGISAGTAIISYTVSGCTATMSVTVTATPAAIGGADKVCESLTITLSDATPGGNWTSSNSSVASVSTSGVVSGVIAGTATISYTVSSCTATLDVTVLPAISCVTEISGLKTPGGELMIAPNPGKGNFTCLVASPVNEAIRITIADMTGRTIQSLATTTNHQQDISLHISPGIYFVYAETKTSRLVAKLVIQ